MADRRAEYKSHYSGSRIDEAIGAVLSGAFQSELTGAPGQVVGFGKDGTPQAQDALTMDEVNAAIDEAITGAIEGVY